MDQMQRLIDIMAALRDPERGCPWDKEQTFSSIVPFTIEETYEVVEAIDQGDMASLKEELGDLLFQVVFYAQMAKEKSEFDFDDIVEGICTKLKRRHPHVFANGAVNGAEEQSKAWEQFKQQERSDKAKIAQRRLSVMDDIPSALPGLMRAVKLQRRAAKVGFDWPNIGPVLAKIEEELAEVRYELEHGGSQQRLSDEIGDLIFACTNLARHTKVDPEVAMRGINQRFERRFRRIESLLAQQNKLPEEVSLDELDVLWNRAKSEEA